ncbi:MAG: TlpA family protein disulfide reductase [Clostridiales bacterium]|nr:TlpA family protein disulfide reductase [Clostridiales bacterium]
MLISVGALSACGKHVHEFGDYEILTAADCETPGERARTCLSCRYTETEVIPAGHDWSDFEIVKYADCETKGEQRRICSVCEYEDIEILPSLGHNWSEFTVTSPAKCEVAGKQTRTCETCKKEETVDLPALEHNWSAYQVTPATCEKVGTKVRTCDLCHVEESVDIPKADHTWSAYSVVVEAKCGVKGEKKRSCDVCHIEEKAEIAALQHVWEDEQITKDPTCVDEGLKTVKCKLCETVNSEEVIPALGHTKQSGFPVVGATCEGEGAAWNTCSVCGNGYKEAIPPLGHDYSDEFTTDITPTASTEGQESRHCTRSGCDSKTDIRSLPRLVSESYFRIYVVRGENLKPTKLPLVQITNSNGVQVASGYCFADDDGRYVFERRLAFGTYTVTLSNVTEGFVHGEYTISEQDGKYPYDSPETYPSITIHLYSYLGEGEMAAGSKRQTVLNDFSFTTIDGEHVWLSDLLKTKKMVWLNFYYNACNPCQAEAPTIARLAEKYKDDLAVVCFNGKDDPDSIRSGAANIFKYPDSFYFVDDRGAVYGKMFGRSGYPLNVFIDSGGYVFESVSGSNYSSQFDSFIRNNLFETPAREDNNAASVSVTVYEVLLPDKQRYL